MRAGWLRDTVGAMEKQQTEAPEPGRAPAPAPGPDAYDLPWKEAIQSAFAEFMAFYFPRAAAGIDWTAGHDFLDKELHQVVRDAASGKRYVDVLVQVRGLYGAEQLLYVHVEVQTQREEDFARRMFTYHRRLIDRWGEAVASFAVLADSSPKWRPSQYRMQVLGCECVFRFPVAKLLDHEPRLAELKRDANPFALVTAAHLSALRTKGDAGRRFAAKRELVRLLYTQGWGRQRVIDLFTIIDWIMALPKPLEQQVWQDIEDIERRAQMRYVTSVERLAIERGLAKGIAEGRAKGLAEGKAEGKAEGLAEGRTEGRIETLARLLTRRFGPLPEWAAERLRAAAPEQLDQWTDLVLDAATLREVLGGH